MDNNSNPFKPATEHSDKKQKLNKNTYFDYASVKKNYDNLDEQFQNAISRSRHQRIKTYASERHSSAREINQRRKEVYQTNPEIRTVSTGEIDTELINLSLESEKDLHDWRIIQQGIIDEICAEDEKGVPEVTTEVLPIIDAHYHEISKLFSTAPKQSSEAEQNSSVQETSERETPEQETPEQEAPEQETSEQEIYSSEQIEEEDEITPEDNLPEEVKERESHDEFHEREKELVNDFFNNIVIPENTFKKPPVYNPPESFDRGLISEEPIDNIEEIEAGLDGKEKPNTAELEKTRLFDVITQLEEDSESDEKTDEENDTESSSIFDNLQQTDRLEPVDLSDTADLTAAIFAEPEETDISADEQTQESSGAVSSRTEDTAVFGPAAAVMQPPLRFFEDSELRNSLIGLAVSLVLVIAYVLVYRTGFTSSDWITLAILGVGMVLTSDLSHKNVLILCAAVYALLIFMIMYQVYLKDYTISYYTYFWFLIIPLCLETAYAFLNNFGCWTEEKHRYARYLKSRKYSDFSVGTDTGIFEEETEVHLSEQQSDEKTDSESVISSESADSAAVNEFDLEITYPDAEENLSDETAFLNLGKNLDKELDKMNAEKSSEQPEDNFDDELYDQIIDDAEHTSWIAGELEEIRSIDQNSVESEEDDEDDRLSREFKAFFDDNDE